MAFSKYKKISVFSYWIALALSKTYAFIKTFVNSYAARKPVWYFPLKSDKNLTNEVPSWLAIQDY